MLSARQVCHAGRSRSEMSAVLLAVKMLSAETCRSQLRVQHYFAGAKRPYTAQRAAAAAQPLQHRTGS